MKKTFLVPLITPYHKDYSVDYKGLKAAAKHAMRQGADGFYVNGSSGEWSLLTLEERKKCLEAVREAEPQAYIVNHIGHPELHQAMDLAKHSAEAGADMVASLPPAIFQYTFEEYKDYYRRLADMSEIPLMIYNLPSGGISFELDQLLELVSLDNITAMKFTDSNTFQVERIKSCSDTFIYSGYDEGFLSTLAAGADGAIGTTFNYMLRCYIETKECFDQGKMKEALRYQGRANAVTAKILNSKILSITKYFMMLEGVEINDLSRLPHAQLTDEERIELEKFFERNQVKEFMYD